MCRIDVRGRQRGSAELEIPPPHSYGEPEIRMSYRDPPSRMIFLQDKCESRNRHEQVLKVNERLTMPFHRVWYWHRLVNT